MATATPYHRLVESGASLTDSELIADIDDCDPSAVSAIVERNRAALESARNVLGPQCVVPLRYDQSFYAEHLAHISPLRNLARMFRAEAHSAARNNDHEAAASIGLDILDLANAIRRGGLVTDMLVGIAVSGIAIEPLRKNRAHFNSATRRRLIRELRHLESQREPFAEIVTRDRNWETAVGFDNQPGDFTSCEMSDESSLSDEQRAVRELIRQVAQLPKSDLEKMHFDLDRQVLALMRLLAIELALRDRCESCGCFPEQLSSLAPELLPGLPLDPFTDAPFIYRRAGNTRFDLYSTGPKLNDGGGTIGPWPLVAGGCADLYLDAADHWPE